MIVLFVSCRGHHPSEYQSSCRYAGYFDLVMGEDGQCRAVTIISPFDSSVDTIHIDSSPSSIVCMSSSHVACLSAVGSGHLIKGVSGIRYITDDAIRKRALSEGSDRVLDIGYDGNMDFEGIISLEPDHIFGYALSSSTSPSISKLQSLGLKVNVIYDHLEKHPLARAEYVRFFGALTGRLEEADSIFNEVCSRYETASAGMRGSEPVKVLLNVPYADVWYIPGEDSYMARLVNDAGGVVLGAAGGTATSEAVSLEKAYALSKEADLWLNPGSCRSRTELAALHPLFPQFGPLLRNLPIYNNTLRITPEGGNDFWESGVVRPDLILEDLCDILSGNSDDSSLNYFFPL